MTTTQWFEQATAYFGGAMTAGEMQVFEKETAADEQLSQLMQLWKTTDTEAALYEKFKDEAAALMATHERLKPSFIEKNSDSPEINAPVRRPLSSMHFSIWQWAAVAAVLMGIIFIADLLLAPQKEQAVAHQQAPADTAAASSSNDTATALKQQQADTIDKVATTPNTSSSQTLYAQAFTKDEVPENFGGPLDNAFFYYNSGKYEQAIEAIDNMGSAGATRSDNSAAALTDFYALYYKALSLMLLNKADAAIAPLEQCVRQSPAETFKAKAQWYLALANLKQGNIIAARTTLQQLINNPASDLYKPKAKTLLAELQP